MSAAAKEQFDLCNFYSMPSTPVGGLDRALVNIGVYPKPLSPTDRREIAIVEHIFGGLTLRDLPLLQEEMALRLHAIFLIAGKSIQKHHGMNVDSATIDASRQVLEYILPNWQEDFRILFDTAQFNQIRSVQLTERVRQRLNMQKILGILNNSDTHLYRCRRDNASLERDHDLVAYNEDLNTRVITKGLGRIFQTQPGLMPQS